MPDDAALWASLAADGAASYNALYYSAADGLYRDVDCANASASASAAAAAASAVSAATATAAAGAAIARAAKPAAGAAAVHPVPPPCRSDAKDGHMSVQTAQSLPLFLGLPASKDEARRVGDALAADIMTGQCV